jgi:hypothetical protein
MAPALASSPSTQAQPLTNLSTGAPPPNPAATRSAPTPSPSPHGSQPSA